MLGPPSTPGRPGLIPDFYTFRAEAQRKQVKRLGLPPGVRVPHMLGQGAIAADWEDALVEGFERGGSLTRASWNLLSPNGKRLVVRSRRCSRDAAVKDVIDQWMYPLRGGRISR